MAKLLGIMLLSMALSFACGESGKKPTSDDVPHFTNLIVGGGPAGLYTAWRIASLRSHNETTAIYEWSPKRLGGRTFTKTFDGGQFLELGGMRFTNKHRLLNAVLAELNLTGSILSFNMTENRLYYVRGAHIYHRDIAKKGMPYNTVFNKTLPDTLFRDISRKMYPSMNDDRRRWCKFFDDAVFPGNVSSRIYRGNDTLGNMGYWNLLLDQLGGEGFEYASDTGEFASHVLNSHAAYSIYYNGDFETLTEYKRLRNGFSVMIDKLESKCSGNDVDIQKGQRLTQFYWNATERKFNSKFRRYNEDGSPTNEIIRVTSDRLFLCVPKRSLELLEEADVVGDFPSKEKRVLKHSKGNFYVDSIIKKPAYKIALLYAEPWWLNATYKPFLNSSFDSIPYKVAATQNYGPTVTDLPLRSIYYFGNNIEATRNPKVFGLVATYDDMRYTRFWEELELRTNESLNHEHPAFVQPLSTGTEITETMEQTLREQLNMVHFGDQKTIQVPKAIEGYYMNWGRDPFGSGYHGWRAHYKLAEVQYYMTRPSEANNGIEVPLYVAGEAYSFDQGWIEGAFTTAETILIDKIGLTPLVKLPPDYILICRPQTKRERYEGNESPEY